MGNIIDVDVAVAAALVQKETGRTVVGQPETIQLHYDDLNTLKGDDVDPDVVYFGNFQHFTTDSCSAAVSKDSYMDVPSDDIMTIDTSVISTPCESKFTVWNRLNNIPTNPGGIMFYGYKFTLKKTWDVQALGSFANGAGWAIASGINVHSSGTTEATYGLTSGAKKFRLTIDWSGITAGSCSIETSAVVIGTVTADGIQVFEWDGDETDTSIFLIPTTDFDGGYDTTTIKLEALNKH